MDMSLHRLLTFLICLLVPVVALSDEVYLKNGDRLTGTIKTATAGKLILETSYADEVSIRIADIQRMASDKPVKVLLDDQSQLTGILSTNAGNEMVIAADVDSVPQPLPMSRLAAINPPEVPWVKIKGHANAGFNRNRGNTDDDTYHMDTESIFRWINDRVTIAGSGNLEKDNGVKTRQQADLSGKYDHFLDTQWYLYSGLGFGHDKFSDLILRTTVSAGYGYQIHETERTNFSIEAGPAYIWENFDTSKDDEYTAAHWGLSFDHYLFNAWRLQVFHKHSLDWSFDNSSKYLVKTATGLRIPILDRLQATMQVNFDRNNDPAAGTRKNDYEYLLTGGYTW